MSIVFPVVTLTLLYLATSLMGWTFTESAKMSPRPRALLALAWPLALPICVVCLIIGILYFGGRALVLNK